MKIVNIVPASEGLEGRSGTLVILKAILAQHPESSSFDFQLKAEEVRQVLDAQKEAERLELRDDIYSWIVAKLRTANYSGMIAGRIIKSFLDAESLEESQATH